MKGQQFDVPNISPHDTVQLQFFLQTKTNEKIGHIEICLGNKIFNQIEQEIIDNFTLCYQRDCKFFDLKGKYYIIIINQTLAEQQQNNPIPLNITAIPHQIKEDFQPTEFITSQQSQSPSIQKKYNQKQKSTNSLSTQQILSYLELQNINENLKTHVETLEKQIESLESELKDQENVKHHENSNEEMETIMNQIRKMSESENTEVQLEINDAKVHQLQINVDEQQSEILQLRKKNFELEGELIKLELEFKQKCELKDEKKDLQKLFELQKMMEVEQQEYDKIYLECQQELQLFENSGSEIINEKHKLSKQLIELKKQLSTLTQDNQHLQTQINQNMACSHINSLHNAYNSIASHKHIIEQQQFQFLVHQNQQLQSLYQSQNNIIHQLKNKPNQHNLIIQS